MNCRQAVWTRESDEVELERYYVVEMERWRPEGKVTARRAFEPPLTLKSWCAAWNGRKAAIHEARKNGAMRGQFAGDEVAE